MDAIRIGIGLVLIAFIITWNAVQRATRPGASWRDALWLGVIAGLWRLILIVGALMGGPK